MVDHARQQRSFPPNGEGIDRRHGLDGPAVCEIIDGAKRPVVRHGSFRAVLKCARAIRRGGAL